MTKYGINNLVSCDVIVSLIKDSIHCCRTRYMSPTYIRQLLGLWLIEQLTLLYFQNKITTQRNPGVVSCNNVHTLRCYIFWCLDTIVEI